MRMLLRYLLAMVIVGGVAVAVLAIIGPKDAEPAAAGSGSASGTASGSASGTAPAHASPSASAGQPSAASASPISVAGQPKPPADAFPATVMWVSDGDTIGARVGSRSEIKVRLIGIDSPETKRPDMPVDCYGPEASAALTKLLPKGTTIEAAYQKVRRDKFDRDLWDIWLPDGRYVQGYMVSNGFATTLRFGGTDQHAKLLAELEGTAKRNKVGLWGACPQA